MGVEDNPVATAGRAGVNSVSFCCSRCSTPRQSFNKYRDCLVKKISSLHDECVRKLFADDYPNLPFVHGVIEGLLPGEVFVDDAFEPGNCMVVSAASYAFAAGVFSTQQIQSCLDLLRGKAEIKFVLPALSPHQANRFGLEPTPRRQYAYSTATSVEVNNTSGYLVRPLDSEALFKDCIWFDFMSGIFGGTEHFLKRGYGWVLWDAAAGVIASEAYGIASKQFVEIGTVTHPAYRGKGLSTMLCSLLMRHLSGLGLQPIWSCDESNPASWSVAEKLGMHNQLSYNFYKRMLAEP
nr:GNAT family N-acetyltransferase [Pseudomonas sp. Q1]